jgi:hypothetical protein
VKNATLIGTCLAKTVPRHFEKCNIDWNLPCKDHKAFQKLESVLQIP